MLCFNENLPFPNETEEWLVQRDGDTLYFDIFEFLKAKLPPE